MSVPADMPAAYLPLRRMDQVKLDGRDAVVMDPDDPLGVIVQVIVSPADLTWVGRYR